MADAFDAFDEVFITTRRGGGCSHEGSLDAAPTRMGDDRANSLVEIIKAGVELRQDDIPLVLLGKFDISRKGRLAEEIDALDQEAFGFSCPPFSGGRSQPAAAAGKSA